jgi:hypothetical protein
LTRHSDIERLTLTPKDPNGCCDNRPSIPTIGHEYAANEKPIPLPQVQSPDTGEESGCGRFRVYLATHCAALESKADIQRRGQARPDDGDALALTFAQPVVPAEVEEEDEEEAFGRYTGSSNSGWMR